MLLRGAELIIVPTANTKSEPSDAIVDLAKMEVLNHNKHDLERMLQNERSERNRTYIRNRDQIL